MKNTIVILIANLIVLIKEGSSQSNPCPNIFQLKTDGQIVYGVITIPPPGKGLTILAVKIGIRNPTESGKTGLSLVKSVNDAVADAERGVPIQYILNFPQSKQLPHLERITLNNRDICNGPEIPNIHKYGHEHRIQNPEGATQLSYIPMSQPQSEPVHHVSILSPPSYSSYNPPPEGNPWLPNRHLPTPAPVHPSPPRPVTPATPSDGSWVGTLPQAGTCGRTIPFLPTALMIGGTAVVKGEFPWMVAMYYFENGSLKYKCGATLISNTYVITAAHCIKDQSRVHLEFGRHNIADRYEDGYVCRNSTNIIQHPEYISGADNDVALISFYPIEFSSLIKPICLWALGTNFDNILISGTVTGWGQRDNYGTKSNIPSKTNVTKVALDTCRNAHDSFRHLATLKTFCAGGRSSGPCKGDSGGGFYFRHRNVWYLRGIVSHSIGNDWTCNVDTYAVYADLAYCLDWIRPYLLH